MGPASTSRSRTSADANTLRAIAPAAPLSRDVLGYWFVEDLAGVHAGSLVETAPHASAVLTVNMGQPNATSHGGTLPAASLLGPQTGARGWVPSSETYFVMVMMTLPGLCKLFPGTGPHGVDACLDLGALTGDGVAGRLVADVAAAWRPDRVASLLDAWLCDRLLDARAAGRVGRYGLACEALVRGLAPGQAAEAAGVPLRQLQRWTRQAIGIGPGQVRDLARLQASLRAVQLRRGDPVDGYSDQAHQIRSWKRRLGVTPAAYRRRPPSMMATLQARDRTSEERIHYL